MAHLSVAPVVFHPESDASALSGRVVADFLARSPSARDLAERLLGVGVRLGDCIDALTVPASGELRRELAASGFVRVGPERAPAGVELWEQPRALLPLIELGSGAKLRATVRVESVVDYLEASGLGSCTSLEGAPRALVRRAKVGEDRDAELWVAERRAERQRVVEKGTPDAGPGAGAVERHLEAFRLRPRPLAEPAAGFDAALGLARAARAELGDALACELFFEAERRFYERKNRAARVQRSRQDELGVGWLNHDHHTYRSSRAHFRALVGVLEALGLVCRERFYAGRDAGWGAQVLEHPGTGICVFADVDLSPEEVTGDFAHETLPAREGKGTVGLWCELHGEAFLAAGMHHLECQFDIDAITRQLGAHGIGVMHRFSDFPHLKQAFTIGEIWPVAPERLARAERAGLVDAAQAERLARDGALGSH
ncbi:MAG TPA: hypothetical protein VGQ57_05575, partial [Polyangiaceae bacterium]|nr:hypothetical protein [Polyangiaceae bacterium]